MTVHQINIKKLEFEICCPSPVQLVPKRYVVSVSIFTMTDIVYCLVALNQKIQLSHIHLTQNSRYARSMVSDWWKWNHATSTLSIRQHSWV
jgi:hypothetical protein